MESIEETRAFTDQISNYNDFDTTFIWKIENFEMCPNKWGKQMKSPEFSIYNLENPKFQLLLYTGGMNEKSSKYISLYIVKTSFDDDDYTYSGRLGIVTSTEKKICYKFRDYKLRRGNEKGLAKFFEREKFQSTRKDLFLTNGNLTIFCEIDLIKSNESMSIHELQRLKELSSVYGDIYKNEKHCDAFLYVGGKAFNVHKAILEARFPNLIKNIKDNKCKIEGIGLTSMNALLHYIYTGYLNVNELNIFEILSSNYALPSHLKRLLLEDQDKIEATTCIQKQVISFSWDIQNFSSLDSDKVIHYPLIGDYNNKCTWLDIFLSVTTNKAGETFVTISIQRFSKDCQKIVCTVKAADTSKTFDHTYGKEDKWILPNTFSKDMLQTISSEETSDKINLKFEIAVSDGSNMYEFVKKELVFNSSVTNQTTSDLKSFKQDLLKNLFDPKFCNTTILSGKEKFPSHKFILSARSPVFSDLLNLECAKKKNSEIIINDLDAHVIKDMLTYMYLNEDTFGFDTKHTCQIYSAASKYKLTKLKAKCITRFKLTLGDESAGDILFLAHQWNDEELKELEYNFVWSHPLQTANSKDWERVMSERSDLALEVLKRSLLHLASKT